MKLYLHRFADLVGIAGLGALFGYELAKDGWSGSATVPLAVLILGARRYIFRGALARADADWKRRELAAREYEHRARW